MSCYRGSFTSTFLPDEDDDDEGEEEDDNNNRVPIHWQIYEYKFH
jgi:hypothetical protein